MRYYAILLAFFLSAASVLAADFTLYYHDGYGGAQWDEAHMIITIHASGSVIDDGPYTLNTVAGSSFTVNVSNGQIDGNSEYTHYEKTQINSNGEFGDQQFQFGIVDYYDPHGEQHIVNQYWTWEQHYTGNGGATHNTYEKSVTLRSTPFSTPGPSVTPGSGGGGPSPSPGSSPGASPGGSPGASPGGGSPGGGAGDTGDGSGSGGTGGGPGGGSSPGSGNGDGDNDSDGAAGKFPEAAKGKWTPPAGNYGTRSGEVTTGQAGRAKGFSDQGKSMYDSLSNGLAGRFGPEKAPTVKSPANGSVTQWSVDLPKLGSITIKWGWAMPVVTVLRQLTLAGILLWFYSKSYQLVADMVAALSGILSGSTTSGKD